MTILQIAHANDVIGNHWTDVDDIDILDLPHHLASPTFEWEDCLVVRCGTYTGIYNTKECVDVSANSRIVLSMNWEFGIDVVDISNFVKGKSLVERWFDCPNGMWMLYPYRNILSKQQFIRVVLKALSLVEMNTQPWRTTIDKINEKLKNDRVSLGYQFEYWSGTSFPSEQRMQATIILQGIQAIDMDIPYSYTYDVLRSLKRIKPEINIKKLIQAEIPFYEIAKIVTR